MSKEAICPTDSKQTLKELLESAPSGPDFVKGVIDYAKNSINASVWRTSQVLEQQFPEHSKEIRLTIDEICSPPFIFTVIPDLVLQKGPLVLKLENGKPSGGKRFIPANSVLESVYRANPKLGIFRYAVLLYPTRSNYSKNDPEGEERFPEFDHQFAEVIKEGNFKIDSPAAKIMAAAYMVELGKRRAIGSTKEFLKSTCEFGGLTDQSKIKRYLENVFKKRMEIVLQDLAFILEGKNTIENIAEEASLDSDQTQLLLDIAFLKTRVFHFQANPVGIIGFFAGLIAKNKWEEAYTQRDFLVRQFPAAFPSWSREMHNKRLIENRLSNNGVVEEADINGFQKMFFNTRRFERFDITRTNEIIAKSGGLGNAILIELDKETKKDDLERYIRRNMGADLVSAVTPIFLSCLPSEAKFSEFEKIMEKTRGLRFSEPGKLFTRINSFADGFFTSPTRVLRTPEELRILNVELRDEGLVYWYATSLPVEIIDQAGNVQVGTKNYADFGPVLYKTICLSLRKQNISGVLSCEQVKSALRKAYAVELGGNPGLADYRLGVYITSFFASSGIDLINSGRVNVAMFVASV